MSGSGVVPATLALLAVTASLPLYLYGARIVVDADPVRWTDLTRHLRYVLGGLTLTTVPVLGWMAPRLPDQFGGFAVLHAFFGVQAYALLAFALTGIVPIFRAKHGSDQYRRPDDDFALADLHEDVGQWRRRLRVGVFGFLLLWLVAYLLGVVRYLLRYWL